MSSDEIFAAQMWTWPGPMMKRDPAGRIIVVNAAFLQIYGGEVQNWAGNTITGWPAPQPPGSSSRFEARVPQANGGETVYDWLETSLADGSVLSIARDVTAFINTPVAAPAPPPAMQEQPPVQQAAAQAPVQEPQQAIQQQAQAPVQDAAIQEASFQDAPAAPTADVTEPTAATTPMTEQAAPPAAAAPAPPPPAQAEPERDFERRALPIEESGSVLGNNWRDAVIAKAVGGTDLEENTTEEDTANPILETEEESVNSGVKILLAEDNAINALLTRTLLEAEGCNVEVVEDGSLAVEAMKNGRYDMILMDMRMPNMDGLEATRKIRSMDHPSKGLPIVALTANAFDDDRNACFDSGMNDFMTKPVSAEELSEMVKIHTGKAEERLAS